MTTYTKELPSGMTADELDKRFEQAKANADKAWEDAMAVYIPAELQPYLEDFMKGAEPPAGSASVANGDPVRVVTVLGGDLPGSPGTAAVVAGRLDFVQLTNSRR